MNIENLAKKLAYTWDRRYRDVYCGSADAKWLRMTQDNREKWIKTAHAAREDNIPVTGGSAVDVHKRITKLEERLETLERLHNA